jgi:hypothetical protein
MEKNFEIFNRARNIFDRRETILEALAQINVRFFKKIEEELRSRCRKAIN